MQLQQMNGPLGPAWFVSRLAAIGSLELLLATASLSWGATFTNNASIQISDPTSSLTATGTTFTVSCWFRISLPSGQTVSDNMDILMDRADGNESATYSYLIRYNFSNGSVEFVTRGASGAATPISLIQNPFIERWYHVAIARSGASLYPYVDGYSVPVPSGWSPPLGSTAGNGVSIGGINGSSKQFSGDIIEVAIYSSALPPELIRSRRFQDQRTFANLEGYYKLGFSPDAADHYRNFVPAPPQGTDPAVPVGSGTVAFPEVDQAGEQSLFDANLNHGQNALTPLSGAFAWQQTVLARPVPGIALDLSIGYSSALPMQLRSGSTLDPYPRGMLGFNWRQTFDAHVVYGPSPTVIPNEWDVINWDGSVQAWTRTNSAAPLIPRDHTYRGELAQSTSSPDVLWTTPNRLVYLFHDPGDDNYPEMAGRLMQISDLNGNTVQVQWDWNEGFITNVVDSAGGNYRFNYDSKRQLLTNVTFGAWQANFAYDTTNRLISRSLTNTAGTYTNVAATWQFQYGTNGVLAQIIDPLGNTNTLIQYDQYGRRTNQVDALGRATRTEYDQPQTWQMRHTDPAAFQWIESYDRKGHVLAQQDPLGNTTSFTYDTNGNRTGLTEPLGWTTYFAYDNNANVIARTNALGQVSTWVFDDRLNKPLQQITPQPADANGWTTWTNFYAYDAAGNLTNHSDAIGTLVSYTYSTNGLVLTSTDANGDTTTFGYDANGFLNARTDPAGDATTYALNDVGWKLREVNAEGYPTTYSYDLNGNPAEIVDVLGRSFYRTFDPNGNLLTETDGKGKLTSYGYDAANQRTNKIDRTGTNSWTYAYTSRGKVDHVTDPINESVTNYYDAANRLVRISDPLGNCVTNQYDASGNVICFFDKLGRRWVKTYDPLNRLIADADPLGCSRQTVYDTAGRVQQTISPNGFPSFNTYDGRGRLITWVDPQNFPWRYGYDGVGNITNITDALQGH